MSELEEQGRRRRAQEAIEENRAWYHSIELAPGVVTPGHVDMRRVAARVFPDDLSGRRALDVGTFDGFWAFEMEKRGAEVVAIDVERIEHAEWPPVQRERLKRQSDRHGVELGLGFRLASELLGSNVRRVTCNVYDLDPEVIGGPVDFVFSGAIMLHLRDPVKALERIAEALHPGGELRLFEPFSLALTVRSPRTPAARFSAIDTEFNWWVPNLAGLRAWPLAAGFAEVERLALLRPPSVRQMRHLYAALACRTAPAHM
jgi:SAM-dependent methyltransferase